MPVLYCLSMVKNESDIIEAFVRHNARFFDRMFIIDNGSRDDTRAILTALIDEGLPVELRSDGDPSYHQSRIMTAAYHALSKEHAFDYLFLLDADEFVKASGRAELEKALEARPGEDFLLMPWQTYVYTGPPGSGQGPVEAMRLRRREESSPFFKAIIRHEAASAQAKTIAPGNHHISAEGALNFAEIPVSLAHFPVRSAAQITSKAVSGWLSYLSRDPNARHKGESIQWQRIYEQVLRGGEPEDALLQNIAYFYADGHPTISDDGRAVSYDLVEDPMPSPPETRYKGRGLSPLVSAMTTAEAIIEKTWDEATLQAMTEKVRTETAHEIESLKRALAERDREEQQDTIHLDADAARLGGEQELANLNLKHGPVNVRFHYRRGSSDRDHIRDVFTHKRFDLQRLSRGRELSAYSARASEGGRAPLVVDAGAGIGASAVYFSMTIPRSKVLALEPAESNFRILGMNVQKRGITAIRAALTPPHGRVQLAPPAPGRSGFRTEAVESGGLPGISMDDALELEADRCFPFIVKLTIKGAEEPLFASDTAWVDRIPLIIVELHDGMLPGSASSRSFLKCVASRGRDLVTVDGLVYSISNTLKP